MSAIFVLTHCGQLCVGRRDVARKSNTPPSLEGAVAIALAMVVGKMIGAASRTARIATVTKIAETARPRIGEEATGTRTETAIETEIEIATETAIEIVIEIVTASDGGIVTARTVTEKRTETRSEIATGGSPRPADGQDQRGENTARVVTVIAAEIVSTAGVETEVAEIAREIGTTTEIGVEFASTGVVIV